MALSRKYNAREMRFLEEALLSAYFSASLMSLPEKLKK
jgi:hypothetical protein